MTELSREELRQVLASPTLFARTFLGIKPVRYQADLLESNKDCVVIWGRQCHFSEEYISTGRGVIKIGEVKDGDKTIDGIIDGVDKFEDDLYLVKTSAGVKFKTNGKHRLLVHPFKGGEGYWMTVEELSTITKAWKRPRLEFAKPERFELPTIGVNKRKAKLFGYLMSDGYFNGSQSPEFTNTNVEFLNEVERIAVSEYGLSPRRKEHKGAYELYLVQENHGWKEGVRSVNSLKAELIELGMADKKSLGKVIDFDREALIEFVSGFFNGDGCLAELRRKTGDVAYHMEFEIGNHEQVAYEFQYILWRLGVMSYVERLWKADGTRWFYRVNVTRQFVPILSRMIDRSKYPDKFNRMFAQVRAKKNRVQDCEDSWIASVSARKVGRGIVVGFNTPTHRITGYCGAVNHNCGKTTTLAIKALHYALTHPQREILIIAPTQRQAGLMFNKIYDYSKDNEFVKSHTTKRTLGSVEFDSGSKIHCLPAGHEGMSIRGYSASMVIFDEAAYIPDQVFLAIRPSMAVRGEQIILSGTPFGKQGYFYNQYRANEMKKPGARTWDIFKVRTVDSPFVDKNVLAEAKLTYTIDQYAQEYEAEFVADANSFYSMLLVRDAMDDYQYALPDVKKFPASVKLVMGVDIARGGSDETAFCICSVTSDGMYRVEWTEQHSHWLTTETAGRVVELAGAYPDLKIYIDESGVGGGAVDIVRERNVDATGITFSTDKRNRMYTSLKMSLEQHKIQFSGDDKKMASQFGNYSGKQSSDGKYRIVKGEGHDDTVDALALCFAGENGLEWEAFGEGIQLNPIRRFVPEGGVRWSLMRGPG